MAAPIDQRSGNGNLMLQGNQYIKSGLSADPADDSGTGRYGQNGYGGASSDLPGKRTTSGFLPEQTVTKDFRNEEGWQTRKVEASPYNAALGMKNPNKAHETVPKVNFRPVTKR